MLLGVFLVGIAVTCGGLAGTFAPPRLAFMHPAAAQEKASAPWPAGWGNSATLTSSTSRWCGQLLKVNTPQASATLNKPKSALLATTDVITRAPIEVHSLLERQKKTTKTRRATLLFGHRSFARAGCLASLHHVIDDDGYRFDDGTRDT